MTAIGTATTVRSADVRTTTGGKKVAGLDNGQTWESEKLAAENSAKLLASTTAKPTQKAASANRLTPEQTAAIKAAWNRYAYANPGELTRQMQQYGVSAADMVSATGQTSNAVSCMIHCAGQPDGFAGAKPVTSTYETWASMPTETYAQYVTKMQAVRNDPTSAWLNGGASAMTESDWTAQNARAGADKARGVMFGGGDSASQKNQTAIARA